MDEASQSLLPAERRWEYRRREPGRLWWFVLSLVVHLLLLFFAGGWVEPGRLRSEQPFVVRLVPPPPPAPPAGDAQSLPDETVVATEEPVAETPGEDLSDDLTAGTPVGTPEAPALAEEEGSTTPAAIVQPVRGDSVVAEPAAAVPVRRDVAGESARRLLAALDTLGQLPRALPETVTEAAPLAGDRGVPFGAEAGITGPLGRRGLLYLEHPDFPQWAEAEGVVAEARFKFWVSAAGRVTQVTSLARSGHPEFDTLARAALMRWRFEPLPPGEERDEWGEVRIVWGFLQAPTGPRWRR